jgi:L-2-hydroxyglutarate oxidase
MRRCFMKNDVVVVGAGIVGLATAAAIQELKPQAKVLVLEKSDAVGTAQTGHNSGVIHAGLYYSPGSLKAEYCRRGQEATKQFCNTHNIPYKEVGKLVVATNHVEEERLTSLRSRSIENGIKIEDVDRDQLAEIEPRIVGNAAILSPTSGIVDYREIARVLANQIKKRGGTVILRSQVRSISERVGSVTVDSDSGTHHAKFLIGCAGLQADRLARMGGLDTTFRIVPFRGEYYQLPQKKSDLTKHLIYPVPDPDLPFLGVHLSPTIDGRVTVGPNAVLGLSRERYPKGSVSIPDLFSVATYPGMWKFAPGYLKIGLAEIRDSFFINGYLKQVQKYCPSITRENLLPYPAGIRAQAISRDGKAIEDFLFERTARQLHVCNAPSPAATSAFPIGEHIANEILSDTF